MNRPLVMIALVAVVAAGAAVTAAALTLHPPAAEPAPRAAEVASAPEATAEQVHQVCGACHAYPPPDTFPRSSWRKEVKQGYDFLRDSPLRLSYPSLEGVVRYYEARSPEDLPAVRADDAPGQCPVRFARHGHRPPAGSLALAVSHVELAHLSDPVRPDLIACDMRSSRVTALRLADPAPTWRVLGSVPVPAHAEVVDFDGDGIKDVLVASLGAFYPTDGRVGGVVWLRGSAGGTFTPVTLLDGVGRVSDVQAADFDGDGKLDLVVAVFGWRKTGEVLLLENRTTDWSRPAFAPRTLDPRHGAVHVCVCDLNRDGRPDVVALVTQEHEEVVVFLNQGGGRFHRETIWVAPHPAFGGSGIQVVDLDGDGDPDVLLTNGDSLDDNVLKPYHGVQWLENRGTYPFAHRPLAAMHGVERAVAADFDGDGRPDVASVSWLPSNGFPQRERLGLPSVVLLHQAAPGRFDRYTLERGSCDHPTCVAGDLYGDGRAHLVVGNHFFTDPPPGADAVTVWQNLGRVAHPRPGP